MLNDKIPGIMMKCIQAVLIIFFTNYDLKGNSAIKQNRSLFHFEINIRCDFNTQENDTAQTIFTMQFMHGILRNDILGDEEQAMNILL